MTKGIKVARDFIDQAVKVSPEASLVWAGVCVVLPLMTNFQTVSENVKQGFSFASDRLRFHIALEITMRQKMRQKMNDDRSALEVEVYESLLTLFKKLLECQIRCIIMLYNSSVTRSILNLDHWDEIKKDLENQEEVFFRDCHQLRSKSYKDSLDKVNEDLQKSKESLDILVQLQQQLVDHQNDELKRNVRQQEKLCHQAFYLGGNDGADAYKSTLDRIKHPAHGTCNWLLSHISYLEWLS